jgi:hypothetical protein
MIAAYHAVKVGIASAKQNYVAAAPAANTQPRDFVEVKNVKDIRKPTPTGF